MHTVYYSCVNVTEVIFRNCRPTRDGNVKLHCTYCKADSRIQTDFGCSSFKKDTLRKHQLSMKHRLAQDSYINKQQFLSTPEWAPIIYYMQCMLASSRRKVLLPTRSASAIHPSQHRSLLRDNLGLKSKTKPLSSMTQSALFAASYRPTTN